MQHRQLTTAVENLKNIFLGPQIVRGSLDFIKQGVLLQAPRNLRDLKQGCPWDELMHKHHHVDMTFMDLPGRLLPVLLLTRASTGDPQPLGNAALGALFA